MLRDRHEVTSGIEPERNLGELSVGTAHVQQHNEPKGILANAANELALHGQLNRTPSRCHSRLPERKVVIQFEIVRQRLEILDLNLRPLLAVEMREGSFHHGEVGAVAEDLSGQTTDSTPNPVVVDVGYVLSGMLKTESQIFQNGVSLVSRDFAGLSKRDLAELLELDFGA